MSFCIARAVELNRTSAVFLMEKCHRVLGVRRLYSVSMGSLRGSLDSVIRFLPRHGNAFGYHYAVILATELWTSEVLSS